MVGGNVHFDAEIDPMLAAAAYDQKQAVFINDGVAFLVPIEAIDTSMV